MDGYLWHPQSNPSIHSSHPFLLFLPLLPFLWIAVMKYGHVWTISFIIFPHLLHLIPPISHHPEYVH